MATVFVLHANHPQLDTDTSCKVFTGLLCGGQYGHAQLCLDLMFKGKYKSVASLQAETPADVYMRTQNAQGLWVEAPDVQRLHPDGVRSTSVGDVLIVSVDATARLYVVSMEGFTEVTRQFLTGHADLTGAHAPQMEAAHAR